MNLISPVGFNHSTGYEGYVLCDSTGNYYDLGSGAQAGWGTPTVAQPNGPGSIAKLSIARTTTDGLWQLTQTFTKDIKERDFTITMSLKRLLSPIGAPVYLQRWSDLNVDNSFNGDVGDRSSDSIYARQIRSVSLSAGTLTTSHTTGVGAYPYGANDCTTASPAVPSGPGDLSGRVTYDLGGFNTNQIKKVVFRWQVN